MKNLTNKEIVHAYENPEYLKEMFPDAFLEQKKDKTEKALFELYQLVDHYTSTDKIYLVNKLTNIINLIK